MTKLTKLRGVEVDLSPLHWFNQALSGDVIWTTRQRQRVAVKNMGTNHILNVIRMLKGESPFGTHYKCDDLTRANWIEIMTMEANRRGLLLEKH